MEDLLSLFLCVSLCLSNKMKFKNKIVSLRKEGNELGVWYESKPVSGKLPEKVTFRPVFEVSVKRNGRQK